MLENGKLGMELNAAKNRKITALVAQLLSSCIHAEADRNRNRDRRCIIMSLE
jgi:hypothetical protein